MCKKLIYLIACALLLSAASGVQAAVLEITPDAPVPGALDIASLVGSASDPNNVGTGEDPPYANDATTYIAHDRGGQGQTFLTGDQEVLVTGVWVRHVVYTTEIDQTWYSMQPGSQLQIRITDPAASGTDSFVLASEIYEVTGEEANALPVDTTNDQTGTGLWFHVTLDTPVALAANKEYGFDLTSISGLGPVFFFETMGIRDDVEGGNPYPDGSAYVSGEQGAADNVLTPAPGDRVFIIELEAAAVAAPIHSYTFEDGTANDSVGSAHGTLVGDAAVVDGQLVLDGDGDWMDMPGDVIAMNTFEELTIEIMFTSVAGGNTGFHMVTAFGEEGTGDNPGYGYKYVCITPARGDDVSRAMIQTVSMDNDPWSEETGVSDVIEHDDGLPHHMVCTVDDTELAFYIDGVLIGTAALDPPGNSIAGLGTDVARIGKGVYGVDPLWAGSVEELNIYDRALSLNEVQAKYAAGPFKGLVHSYTFEDGTANDSVGSADGTLVGDAAVVDGSLVLDGDGDWMEMPGDVIAMNTYSEVTVETWFTSVEGGNTGFHMLAAFGEEGTGANTGFGYKYLFITPARGDDVSRAAIQTSSMDDSPWDEETGVSATVEHDDGLEHHFVATVDAANITLYIDGEFIGSEPLAAGNEIAGIGQAVAYLGKGVYPVDPLWTGSVDELNIYNRALSLDEVQTKYAAGPQKEGPVSVDPGTDGLMLHLPLDTASRGTTQDSSDNDLDGTVVGDPAFVEGVDILALQLDGVDDYVDCGNPDLLNFGTGDWTVSAWIKTTQSGTGDENKGTIFANGGDQSGGIRYTLAVSETEEGRVTLTTDNDATKVQATGSVVVNDDVWHHVVGIRSGTDLLVYIDGALDGTNTVPDGYDLSGTSQHNAYIGAITDNRDGSLIKLYTGLIDDVRIYNRALSAQEILFLAGK